MRPNEQHRPRSLSTGLSRRVEQRMRIGPLREGALCKPPRPAWAFMVSPRGGGS